MKKKFAINSTFSKLKILNYYERNFRKFSQKKSAFHLLGTALEKIKNFFQFFFLINRSYYLLKSNWYS